MRKFIVRSLSCGLIREEDEKFGKVIEVFAKNPDIVDKQIILKDSQIAHLNEKQQKQLLEVLNRYADRFSELPGLCQLVEHEIQLKDFVQKNSKLIGFHWYIEQKLIVKFSPCYKKTLFDLQPVRWQVRWCL